MPPRHQESAFGVSHPLVLPIPAWFFLSTPERPTPVPSPIAVVFDFWEFQLAPDAISGDSASDLGKGREWLLKFLLLPNRS